MIAFGHRQRWLRKRRPVDVEGETFYKGEWMESDAGPVSPTVFLAEQPANCSLIPHFHRENQFQLFVDGEGRIGRHEIRPGMVHYAGAFTGYGPIVAGATGLKYFTIRAAFDTGYTPVAEARSKMPRGPKVHAESMPWAPRSSIGARQIEEASLIPAAGGGFAATGVLMPPNQGFTVAPAVCPGSVGEFVVVLGGEVRVDDEELRAWESVFLSAEESREIVAGPEGAQFVRLFIPARDPAYAA